MIRDTTTDRPGRRGVSEVIGSILVFGILVALLTVVQTQAVPNTNADIEYQHSQAVKADFMRLTDAVSQTATRRTEETITVETGTTYPSRLVLFNPPPATGTLRSGAETNLSIQNVEALDGDVADYFAGRVGDVSGKELSTARLAYRPDYNEYENAPITAYEYGVVYDEFGDRTLLERRGSVVDGNDIDLRLLAGGVDTSGQLSAAMRTEPLSSGSEAVQITNRSSDPVLLVLPTRLPESVWTQQLLADAIDDPDGGANGAAPEADDRCAIQHGLGASPSTSSSFGSPDPTDDRHVIDCVYIETGEDVPNYVALALEPGVTYNLRMSKVGFASGRTDEPAPKYVVSETGRLEVAPGGERAVAVQVRDGYNNPVSGVAVTAELASGANAALVDPASGTVGNATTATTDSDGVATVPVETGRSFDGDSVTVRADLDDDGTVDAAETSTVRLELPAGLAGTTVEPITLTRATLTGDREVRFALDNAGTEREVVGVHLHSVTVEDRKQVLENANAITSVTGTITGVGGTQTNVTDVLDGPNEVTWIRTGSDPWVRLASPAVENRGPQAPDDVDPAPTIGPGSSGELWLRFDEAFDEDVTDGSFDDGDAISLRVTVEFDDGDRETYDVRIDTAEDDER